MPAFKNRLTTFKRVMLLSQSLDPERVANFGRDFNHWDSAMQSRYTPSEYVNKFKQYTTKMLGKIQAGKSKEVAEWWHDQYEKLVGKSGSINLPPLTE